ncbi:hypothetical protein RchiOBHm_Chr5g0063411 [Rosa chinensis]|uniref:RNase H type-1 domain-containing protein n=1 Tax=Rosa chinensis TaxID=74649 RepID=A0A2P6QIE9_ROSCH|nr:hypothetical protein RchiOBHm_Chr5g0063411 [Rosa chinensis]
MQAEAEALCAGFLVTIHQQWSEVEMEGDSETMLTALTREGEDLSEGSKWCCSPVSTLC